MLPPELGCVRVHVAVVVLVGGGGVLVHVVVGDEPCESTKTKLINA
jgi:hypothetical protein